MDPQDRNAPLDLPPDTFRALGHQLVDDLADFLASLPSRPVTTGETPAEVQAVLGDSALPSQGTDPAVLLEEATKLVIDHSTFNGHPDFLAFITSSAAPIGALGDLLASSVNPNLGGWPLSPMATEIERQTVRWIAEFVGYPSRHGLLVSGGNMANLVAFWAARRAKATWDIRTSGAAAGPRLTAYVSKETHTWVQKAADLSGMGTEAIRWIPTDNRQRMVTSALDEAIERDRADGFLPVLVVGTAGTVSTGAVDPLADIGGLCRRHDLWFHVDGAYGAPAAALPECADEFNGMAEADSIAIDPHKWFYAPLQAGCLLVKDMARLRNTFSYHPTYFPFIDEAPDAPLMYYEYGPENSRGFRALKVWLAFRQVGRDGFVTMIRDDMAMARRLFDRVTEHPEFESATQDLSIATFRYVPPDVDVSDAATGEYLNTLNAQILDRLQETGTTYLSNAVIDEVYFLRACVVNFRTSAGRIDLLPERIATVGRAAHESLQHAG
jgi:glutamate/tyrosine decarboxylase-like PLP-dependent enzyme